jgi:2,4-dienoyl-CoA reductase-like NADH-dependent reductase (Old Yellow Enzyme family)
VPGLRELTKTVHESGAKIAVQLFHGGRASSGYYNYKKESAVAPSYVSNDSGFIGDYRPMTEEEIWEAIQSFGDAAVRVQEAGFDAVQVHGAHGYLLSQFLSPFTNRREDDWGGNLQNRLRFHYEVYKSIRERVGKDYPVMIKIGVQDEVPGGLRLSEGIQTARSMAEWGFDALEISQGLRGARWEGTEQRAHIRSKEQEAYFRAWCQAVKKKVDIPVMMVGGLRSPDLMEEIIQQGEADFISLCRPLIREPGIIREWERGHLRKSACISCNKCYETIEEGKPLACFIEEKRNTQGDV